MLQEEESRQLPADSGKPTLTCLNPGCVVKCVEGLLHIVLQLVLDSYKAVSNRTFQNARANSIKEYKKRIWKMLMVSFATVKTTTKHNSYSKGASVSEIKKQYRALSLKYHPDKGGDEVMFMRIAKAYAALTDEESRKNWEEFGNPDGPQGFSFKKKEKDVFQLVTFSKYLKRLATIKKKVLLVYGLAFMVILPVVVLIREIGGINLKKNEPPLTCPYSLKARVLLLTHLARMKVPEVLEEEREFRAPSLGSLENCMKLSQMTVQGLQQFKSPLLQLPHIEEDNLRRVSNHKKDLVSLKGSDRRNLLHFLEDKKYDEVMAVLGSFPYVTMDIKPQVLDDEDSNNITVGSLVTVLVTLTRQTMAEVFEKEQSICAAEEQPTEDGEVVAKEEEEEISDKGSESEEEETNRDSQSEKDDGSDRDSDREQDEKQNKDDEAVELKFPAPGKPGNYQYTVYLRSDSYMGLDQIKPLKLEVHEAKPVPENHPQWDTAIEGDEDQEDSEGFEDSFEEEEEEEEDDD
ncbi:hypothetical protein llap_1879 [Limosa lapponica baueri]|uniref:J domain-containing protein n=1 Tax=Limosa lapponica baueri TaxID=1758121 RepID=A0A2I0UP61_LIMLA|nr:hypothetical protein llap_1879 [Limosa lapponica baueri]